MVVLWQWHFRLRAPKGGDWILARTLRVLTDLSALRQSYVSLTSVLRQSYISLIAEPLSLSKGEGRGPERREVVAEDLLGRGGRKGRCRHRLCCGSCRFGVPMVVLWQWHFRVRAPKGGD